MIEYICPICRILEKVEISHNNGISLINCPCCGNFFASNLIDYTVEDKKKLPSYLYYHSQRFISNDREGNEHTNFLGNKKDFDETTIPNSTFVTKQMVENWYPKNFSEKMDMILLGFAKQSKYYGDSVALSRDEFFRAFFIDFSFENSETDFQQQVRFINFYLDKNYATSYGNSYTLTPEGWARVDELQKNQAETSKTVFVAMSFATEMKNVRESIRKGIVATGYDAIFIDEKQHNKQIVPEMLYQIRQAKFLVAELTKHNNGAYFEAGYALGLGKEVIQLCSKESFRTDGHFDVKQVSTILWEEENEITEKLRKRIEATIGKLK